MKALLDKPCAVTQDDAETITACFHNQVWQNPPRDPFAREDNRCHPGFIPGNATPVNSDSPSR